MITKEELLELLKSGESYRVERTTSVSDMDKFQEAICAFSNDLPDSRKKGYLIIGANDSGKLSGLKVTDNLLKKIAGIRSDGNILPLPIMSVDKFVFEEGELLVAEISPSLIPPVRYRGRTFIRIGPCRDIATEAEERILYERRAAFMATFDAMPCFSSSVNDLDISSFHNKYLAKSIDSDILASDKRCIEEQMASVGMFDLEHNCPTYAAIILFGKQPRRFLPGAYIQFVRFKGETIGSEIDDERQFDDNYCDLLPKLESLLEISVIKKYPVKVSLLREEMVTNYPYWAIRELLMNACMHRNLQSNMPVRIYEYSDRLEIMNAGGLYGNARPENFPSVNDYRNPIVSGAMKTLGYVNMFNRGIGQVEEELSANGNPPARFDVNLVTAFKVTVLKATSRREGGHKSAGQEGTSRKAEGHKSAAQEGTSRKAEGHKSTGQEGTSRKAEGHYGNKRRPFGRSVLTLQERVIEFCSVPRSMHEIIGFLGIKNVRKARERYINPQLGITLKRTIPDKPTSSKQKYVIIDYDSGNVD